MPRSSDGAVIHDAASVVARAVRMAREGVVEAGGGAVVACRVASICVHGDTPGAVDLAGRVRAGLRDSGLEVVAFTVA